MSVAKKVLHIITGLGDGGAEGVLTRICINSTKAEHVVISLMDKGKYGSILEDSGIRVYTLGMSSGRPSPLKFMKLVRWIRNESPDVVQTWMYHADLFGGIAARFARVPRVVWGIRQTALDKRNLGTLTVLIARFCAKLSYVVPHNIVCCAEKARMVHAEMGYQRRKLVVIPNGYDIGKFSESDTLRSQLRSELNVREGEVLIGMVGRYAPQKDHAMLLRAVSRCVERDNSIRCLLVGRGLDPDNEEITTLIRGLNLEEYIILAGQQADVPKIMNGIDIHCLSSRTEGFPNVLAESMACGTPVVSTDVGDAALIVGETGYVCKSEDSVALSDGIMSLINEMRERPQAWARRKKEAEKRIAENFSIERTIGLFESVWKL